MNDSPSRPKDNPSGKRKASETVPSMDARAAAQEALRHAEEKLGLGETLIVPPPGATERLITPLDSLVSPSEGTVRLQRDMATEVGPPEAGALDPNATARLPRKDLVSPSEGTMLMAAVPPLPPTAAVQGEPDTVPGLAPEPSPHEGTLLMSVGDLHPAARPGDSTVILKVGEPTAPSPGEGTLVLPVMAKDPAPSEGTMVLPVMVKDPAPSEGTMVLPVMAKDPAPSEGTMVLPVIVKDPAPSEGTMVLPVMAKEPAPSEGTMVLPVMAKEPVPSAGTKLPAMESAPPPAPLPMEDTRPDLLPPAPHPEASRAAEGTLLMPVPPEPREASVPTAAEVIRETLPEEPALEARTIRVTQANLPELRMPELPELAPPEPPAPAAPTVAIAAPVDPGPAMDEEAPRATLHMPLRDMPESRYREAPRPEPLPSPVEPTVALSAREPLFPIPEPAAAPPEPTPASAASPAATHRIPKPAVAETDPGSRPGRSFALVWGGVIGLVILGFAGLFAWQMGWFRPASKGAAQGGDNGPGQVPKAKISATDDASKVPEPMRPAYEKALAGDPNAMLFIATCYTQGLYVSRDPQEGLKWYRRAAAAGNATAQRDLRALEAQGIR